MLKAYSHFAKFVFFISCLYVNISKNFHMKEAEPYDQDAKEKHEERKFLWLPLFGFFILFSETGVRQIMPIFVESVMNEFNCTKTEADTVAIAIPSASSLLAGPLAAMVYQYYGARVSICAGTIMCLAGFLLGSFATDITLLYPYGLTIGLGCSLMRNAIISVQCEYFKAHRNMAMSFISIGPGIGIFILPRILMPMIEAYSWRMSWRVLCCVYVACFIMALFIVRKPSTKANTFAQLTGIGIWKRGEFILHVLACFCASAVCIIYISNILVLMRSEKIEAPEKVYSYNGIASIIGRALLTLMMGSYKLHIAIVMVATYGIAQTALFSAVFCETVWEFRVQNFFSGFGMGMFQAVLAPFLLTIIGPSQLPGALGYTNLINGLAAFAGINAAGAVVDAYQSSRAAFVLSILLGLLAIIFSFMTSALFLYKEKRNRKNTVETKSVNEELKPLQTQTNCKP